MSAQRTAIAKKPTNTDTPPSQLAGTIKLDAVNGTCRACLLLREYQRLLEARGSRDTEEERAILAQLEQTICARETDLTRAQTLLRETEYQLHHAQKMEAIGRLAGGVAHDFNNILSVILGSVDLALPELKQGSPVREDMEMIRDAGLRGAALTRQLLTFSRRSAPEPKVLDTQSLLGDIERMLRRVLGEDIVLACQVASPAPRVRADAGLLEQVLMNLAVNARDAMPHGGQLDIEISSRVLRESVADIPAGSYAVITVSDTGVGIDPATQTRIFEPFFTTKEPGRGTGLGLSTVAGIVRQCGGSISVASELGKGTVFTIYLPNETASVETQPEETTTRHARGTETILLVEDDEQVRLVARGMLRRHGYHVIEARNAGEALLACERQPARIHLLVTDVILPQMNGAELATRLSQIRPDMKVLFMSGYTSDAQPSNETTKQLAPYLQKPLTVDALTRKVREVLDGGAALAASSAPQPQIATRTASGRL